VHYCQQWQEQSKANGVLPEESRKEKTTPFGVNLMRSQVFHRAGQGRGEQTNTNKTWQAVRAYGATRAWDVLAEA